jgi:hypothetical protein
MVVESSKTITGVSAAIGPKDVMPETAKGLLVEHE